jgi:hypothetical protein
MKTLYLAKEPDAGVRNDLARLSGEVTVVDCKNAYRRWYERKGYKCISRTEFFTLDDMKFDIIIGNPPYQSPKDSGDKRGSANSPLWMKIVKQSLSLLKENGTMSLITPVNIVNGGDMLTRDFLGEGRQYDLKYLDFSTNKFFNIGIPICRWIISNSLTEGNTVTVADGRVIDTSNVTKISDDVMFDSIVNSLVSYPRSLGFNTKKAFHYSNVENTLVKNGEPKEWARDLQTTSDDTYKYPININGKLKYSRVKVMDGCWRVFVPQMQVPTQISVGYDTVPATSTFNVIVDSKEEAEKIKEIIEDERYQWIINNTRVSGRISPIIGKFANAPIEEVLTSEQLTYIQSQLYAS